MMTDNDNPFADPSVSGASGAGGGDSSYDQLPPSSENPTSSVEDWLESAPEEGEYSTAAYSEGPMESLEQESFITQQKTNNQPSQPSRSGSTTVTNLKKITDAVAEIRTAPLSKLIFYMRVSVNSFKME